MLLESYFELHQYYARPVGRILVLGLRLAPPGGVWASHRYYYGAMLRCCCCYRSSKNNYRAVLCYESISCYDTLFYRYQGIKPGTVRYLYLVPVPVPKNQVGSR